MDYVVKRMKRKTLGIYILKDGSVEVRAPRNVRRNTIDDFVASKQEWIQQAQARALALKDCQDSFELKDGSRLLVLGKAVPLVVCDGGKACFDGSAFYVIEGKPLKPQVIEVYRQLARQTIARRIALYAPKMGVAPAGLTITSARTRWGSCSGKNRLSFSWKLIMAPLSAVDYVVVHELAHIWEHNHSKSFWKIVRCYYPNIEAAKETLKHLAEKLLTENWEL